MPKFSVANMPEVFVSDTAISKAVSEAAARGELRKLGSRLYTRNLDEDPEKLVRRNWYQLITAYYPDALITDRTSLENKPAADGSVCLISKKKRDTELPGIIFRPRKGPEPLESDKPFIGGARFVSTARAYLENMRASRARGERLARTLPREEIEKRLDFMLRQQGEEALNRLRDEARAIAQPLALQAEFEELDKLIGALLGTRDAEIQSPVARARVAGAPYDPDRLVLFETLFSALREYMPKDRPDPDRTREARSTLSFFEAYFSNFIEGTEFTVEEAEGIVFEGVIPQERPDDAHDVLGTFRIVSDSAEMKKVPQTFETFLELLRGRHALFMAERPDKNPGVFKTQSNRAGNTIFVEPDLVNGTLAKGFEFLQGLSEPLHRAIFMMFVVSEVHPFTDGNGRAARIMMNAELIAEGQERIIIPTVFRVDYLGALKALSRNSNPAPIIRMLEYAQRYTHEIDWSDLKTAQAMLTETGAFSEDENAKLLMPT
ncbi:MAG: cell filamentation protein Fic [Alphaproteobacteria bacterium]|nr:MAG: cell filamentation protein Fic [Alphaproteobacteria bacterium]